MSTPTFRTTVENELGVIREAECDTRAVLWSIRSTRSGTVIHRTDDNTTICMRVPKELLRALVRELDEQATALERAGVHCGERA